MSTDADVLVRPAHVRVFMAALRAHGWRVVTSFSTGSAFEHAASLWHTELGYVDVHRRFPGITVSAATAFDRFWLDRQTAQIANRPCWVPSVDAQRFLLILHAARGGGPDNSDVRLVWTDAGSGHRDRVRTLAWELRADVALAAATGHLDDYAADPTYDLWRIFSRADSGSRLAEWKARIKAEPTGSGRLRLAARSVLVNTDHLAMELRRPPTRAEVAGEYVHRASLLGREVWRATRRAVRRGDEPGERR